MTNEDFEELDFIQPHKTVRKLISVDVLDKIRTEIDEQYDLVRPYNIYCAEGLDKALEIIDKYKESEDKE